MARIVIIGGHGKVALRLAPLLAGRGDTVTALIRNPDHKADVEATGAVPVLADVELLTTPQLADLFRGNDAVVWSAGAGEATPHAPTPSTVTRRSGRWPPPPTPGCRVT
ncbi:NAD(P)H-binding protein [Tessaracoccus coleopterorum]|uniref:NAD(P)H-binding protein n=1 Tax=Tessaracoccus coleopterorum TaxID=2714950 RepID=UPI001E634F75|nr:NAD(P)H-binding protein [Tessaracoccus coleopterorum]